MLTISAFFDKTSGGGSWIICRCDPIQKLISTGFCRASGSAGRIGMVTTLGLFMPHTLALVPGCRSTCWIGSVTALRSLSPCEMNQKIGIPRLGRRGARPFFGIAPFEGGRNRLPSEDDHVPFAHVVVRERRHPAVPDQSGHGRHHGLELFEPGDEFGSHRDVPSRQDRFGWSSDPAPLLREF